MKPFFNMLALFAASAFAGLHEQVRHLESLPCIDSKIVVEEAPEVTYFRIIADSGETLLDINSNNTKLTPFDLCLEFEFRFPDYGHWVFANNTRYYITKNQTTAGDLIRFAGKIGLDLLKEKGDVGYKKASVIKSDVRCVRIHGFSVVIDPAFDIKKHDGYNMTALLWSSLFGLGDVARDLIERGADMKQRVGQNGSPALAAVLSDQPQLVEFMIQKGADIVRNENPFSFLHMAAYAGSTDVARILIDRGIDVNEGNNPPRATPLHFAATFGQCGTIEALVNRGANVNALLRGNLTAFQLAISHGHLDCGHKLIAAGADVNSRDGQGNTALTEALIHQEDETKLVEIINRFLREFNPDVNIRNNNGDTALSIATRKNFTKVAELLKSKGAV